LRGEDEKMKAKEKKEKLSRKEKEGSKYQQS